MPIVDEDTLKTLRNAVESPSDYSSGEERNELRAALDLAASQITAHVFHFEMKTRMMLAIERALNDVLVEEPDPFIPEGGISTAITKPTIRKCFTTLKHRNWFFWLPYLVVSLACLALWFAGIGTHEATPKIALVTDSSIESSTVHSVRLSDWERQWTRIADSLWDIDVKLSKERPVTVQLQVPTPTVTPASPTPEWSRSPGRRKRSH